MWCNALNTLQSVWPQTTLKLSLQKLIHSLIWSLVASFAAWRKSYRYWKMSARYSDMLTAIGVSENFISDSKTSRIVSSSPIKVSNLRRTLS